MIQRAAASDSDVDADKEEKHTRRDTGSPWVLGSITTVSTSYHWRERRARHTLQSTLLMPNTFSSTATAGKQARNVRIIAKKGRASACWKKALSRCKVEQGLQGNPQMY